jgi:hypothetical protein
MLRRLNWVELVLMMAIAACGGNAEIPVSAEPANGISSDVPADVDPSARYLIYLHGRIIEDQGVRPTHPVFGIYEYEEILETFANRGFVVISETRPSATDVTEYAGKVVAQVKALLGAGVPPEHLTVVGFSKGGGIAILASSMLANDRVNFVFIGACGPWYADRPEIEPRGQLLGLREASDDLAGPCDVLFARAPAGSDQAEIVLELGGGHGAFYRPHPEWVEPVVEWALARE